MIYAHKVPISQDRVRKQVQGLGKDIAMGDTHWKMKIHENRQDRQREEEIRQEVEDLKEEIVLMPGFVLVENYLLRLVDGGEARWLQLSDFFRSLWYRRQRCFLVERFWLRFERSTQRPILCRER